MALFCIHFAGNVLLGLIHVAVAPGMTRVRRQHPELRQLYLRFIAPVVTGFIVDTTHSIPAVLVICGCVHRSRRAGLHLPGPAAD